MRPPDATAGGGAAPSETATTPTDDAARNANKTRRGAAAAAAMAMGIRRLILFLSLCIPRVGVGILAASFIGSSSSPRRKSTKRAAPFHFAHVKRKNELFALSPPI